MKKAFTLIEIVIVLVVIGILMAATMKFGSDRIMDLRAQGLKDQFVDTYALIQAQNLASNFRAGERYTTLTISFASSGILARYDGLADVQLLPDIQAMQVSHIVGTPTLSLTPYHMGCILDGGTGLSFILQVHGNKSYCFSISPATCTLKELPCGTE